MVDVVSVGGAIHRFAVRVYFEDTDAAGIVYHTAYLRFMERARTEYLRDAGIAHGAFFRQTGCAFAVRRVSIDYRRAAHLDDLLVVESRLESIRGASITLRQWVARGEQCLIDATVGLAFINAKGRASRLPADMVGRLRAITENSVSGAGA